LLSWKVCRRYPFHHLIVPTAILVLLKKPDAIF